MSHRGGWRRCHRRGRIAAGGAAGACAAGGVRAEPPPGRPALAGWQLTPQEHTHPGFMTFYWGRARMDRDANGVGVT